MLSNDIEAASNLVMRDERKKTRDTEGSDKRDNRRSLSIRDVSLVRLARNGDLDSVKQMIKDGANVNEQDESGWTALHEVCMRNVPRMVEYLLRHGADPGIVNVNGDTALHCAVRIGSLRTVRALLYYNANPLVSNHKGDKPLDLCQDSEVSSFLKQHIDNNQLNMVSSSGHGKLKVSRQHSTTSHNTKHLTSSSSSVEHYTGSKDNNSLTSISDDVYSDSDGHDDNGNENDGDADDDGYSNLGVSKSTTHLSHSHNMISPTNSHHSDMMNNLSSSGQYSHQTSSSSPSVLSSVQKCMPDMHSSTKSSKKDPYAFEDDENDDTVNSSANTLLHSSAVSTGQIGIHSNCSSSGGGGGGGGAGFIGTVTSTRSNITNTSPNNSGSSLLSKPSRQISSSNLSTVVESGNTSSDSNHSYNTTGGPPLRLRFAKEAGQYTLMEQQQQQQVDLSSLSNCDINSSGGTTEVSNFNSMNDNNTSGGSSNNNNNIAGHLDSNTNNIDNRNDQDVGLLVSMRSEQLTGQDLDNISTSCQSESSGGEESSQKVPPLRIKFASGTSGDNESSVTSLSASVGAPSGYSIHLNNSDSHNNNDNNLENNGNDEVDRKDKFDIKSRLSVDDVSRSDGKELAASISTNTLNTISSSTSEKEKIDRSHDHGLSHHSKTHRSHSHNTTMNPNTSQHPVDSSTSLSTSSSPVPTTCSTPTTTTVNSTGNSGVVSSTGTGSSSRSKVESTQEANNSHANNASSNSSSRTTNSNRETGKETHRHRSGRTLRSHTAAQREKEEKERHTDDTSPIKKRKLRSRSDASSHDSNTTTNNNSNSQNRNSGNTAAGNDHSSSAVTTTQSGSTPTSSVLSSTNTAVVNTEVSNDLPLTSSTTIPQVDTPMTNEEKKPPVVSAQTVITDEDTDVPMPDVSELEQKPVSMDVDVKSETCGSPASVATLSMDTTTNMDVQVPSTITPPSLSSSVSITTTTTTTPAVTMSTASVEQSGGCQGEADTNVDYLLCPAGPGDEDRKDIELLKFQNPYEKAAELNKGLRELVKNLVKVHPKAPCGYQDYLLVTRNYLLANQPSFATYMKRLPPGNLEPAFVELFNEQEEERYAQALKHQSEREHLQLGAEQAVLRAQTRGALAVANQSKPYSFCSILSYNDLTYIPPVGKEDNREEESVRGRFTPRTFIGWLQDIIDTYQSEKKKLLCRQLHEAESLMMVQKLDWEMKARETLANVDCIGLDGFKDIPGSCVPMIPVPNDFPLFAHDPVHRSTSMTMTSNSNSNSNTGGNPISATSTVMNSISTPAIKTTAPTNTVSTTTSNP
ncbi:unnamed protein product [Trichobilharzia szidati]|nr:unnamed protein product [Trichobilharzia szidati]